MFQNFVKTAIAVPLTGVTVIPVNTVARGSLHRLIITQTAGSLVALSADVYNSSDVVGLLAGDATGKTALPYKIMPTQTSSTNGIVELFDQSGFGFFNSARVETKSESKLYVAIKVVGADVARLYTIALTIDVHVSG